MRVRRCKVVMNPRGLKPVHAITDRAKRYRANTKANRPGPPKRCGYCGSKRSVEIDHINGREADGDPQNLMWACRSCNTRKANMLRKVGLGKLTRQYNPAGSRRDQFKAYGDAIKVMRGVFPGDVAKAVAVIRGTPRDVRSDYTAKTWTVRRQIYGPAGRQAGLFESVPF